MVDKKSKKSKSYKQNSEKIKVGGSPCCGGDKSPKRRSKKVIAKKCASCGCGGNKRRTHKAQKGGAVRAGTVVQNMPVRQKGGAVRAGTVVQNIPLKH